MRGSAKGLAIRGDNVRPWCSQGHRSAPGQQFCQTCGEFLQATQSYRISGGQAPVLDYQTGSFAEGLARIAEREQYWPAQPELAGSEPFEPEPAWPVQPEPDWAELAWPEPAPVPARAAWAAGPAEPLDRTRLPGAWRDAYPDGTVGLPPRHRGTSPAPSTPSPPPRRATRRILVTLLALAVLAGVVTTGAMILRHRALPTAQPPPRPAGPSAVHPAKPGSPRASRPAATQLAMGSWVGPIPIDLSAGHGILSGLSCPQPYACYAIDSAGNVLYRATSPLPVRSWQVTARDQHGGLVAISCASARSCLAVDTSGHALAMSQGQWHGVSYVDARSGTFTSVSCPVVAFCMAVDSGGNAFAYRAATRTWQPFTVDRGRRLTGVSCASRADCVAVSRGGSVYTYNGTSWSAADAVDSGRAFTAVSCGAPGFCVAADVAGRAAVRSGRGWSVAPMGLTATAVSCPAAGFCVATDGSGDAVSYRNGVWSAVRQIDGSSVLAAVSCPVVTSCTAADQQDDVLYYTSAG